jgi:putative transposase
MVRQGRPATLVAATLEISRSSLYYRKKPRGSRADRQHDEQIVLACGDKPAYGYRRVAWWLRRKENLVVNRKRVLRVMRERGLLVRSRRLRAGRKKEWGRVEAAEPNQIWQSDMTKIWAGPTVGWAYLVSVIDCCTQFRTRNGVRSRESRRLCSQMFPNPFRSLVLPEDSTN